MRITVVILATLLGLAAPPAVAQAVESIQPGDYVNVDDVGGCTLGWLFDAPTGEVFFASAAHCFKNNEVVEIAAPSGQEESAPATGDVLGAVRVRGNPDNVETDVALIEVREELESRVTGELRGHLGIPTGVADGAKPGDTLQMSGFGAYVNQTPQTRERRVGLLSRVFGTHWEGAIPGTGGDSGGPIAHVPSGGALGLVKGYTCRFGSVDYTLCGAWGPSIQSIRNVAATAGITLSLRAAGQAAPVPAPPARPEPSPSAPQSQAGGESRPAPQPRPATTRTGSRREACRKKAKRIRSARKRGRALRRCARIERG